MKNRKSKAVRSSSDFHLLARLFFRLLPYQILLIVINAANGIVDGLFASNAIGPDAMSAIGLYTPMTHFLYALSIMMVGGSQLLYGSYLAEKPDSVHSVFSVDPVVSFVVSALTSLAMILGVVTHLTDMAVSDAVQRSMFNRYLIGQSVGIPALVLGQQLFSFLSLENQTKRTMTAGIICFVTNAAADALLTVVFPLGTLGLGLASSISVWLFFGFQALYFISGKSHLKFSIKSCRWKDAPRIAVRGYSGALSRFVEMFRCLIVNVLIMKFVGNAGLSSFSASNSFLGVIWSIPFGMIAVQRMLMSISVGEEDRESLKDTMRVILRIGVPIMIVVAGLIIAAAVPLTRMFYRDPSDPIYDMTVMGFRMLPICMPLAVVSLSFACYAQAAQKKLMSIVLPIIDGFAGVSLTSLFLIPLMKMNGLYLANILNGIICILVIILFAYLEKKRFPGSIDDLMMIPDDFGPSELDRIDISVRGMEDVENVSTQVEGFGTMRGIDHRRALFASVALEEMAGNIVEHGFTKDKRPKHIIDIRVIHRGDDVILRMRDDCLPFDPSKRELLLEPEDKAHNVGIRLVYKISKKVEYQNLLGCNVLTVTI
ncbi:MAG: ATP-binding protein [Lachnospiraceae bacterium]|nr:ATP-binding protein [Lachnospiraceae bacterium]